MAFILAQCATMTLALTDFMNINITPQKYLMPSFLKQLFWRIRFISLCTIIQTLMEKNSKAIYTLNTSSDSTNSVCISLTNHWFHILSLSTSSLEEGTSKSPEADKIIKF